MTPLTDESPMPWGRYKDIIMREVPASYLHWCWTRPQDPLSRKVKTDPVAEYINRNLTALKIEHDDGIWE